MVGNSVCQGGQIRHLHVRRQRIELRGAGLVAVPHVQGQRHPQFAGKHFAQLDGSVGVQPLQGLPLPFLHALFKAAPTRDGHVGCDTHVGQVGQRGIGLGHRCPSPVVVEACQTQFVHPHLGALGLPIVSGPQGLLQILVRIAETHHDGDHIAECGISLHRQTTLAAVVHNRIHPCRRHPIHVTVAQFVEAQQPQRVQVDVDVVLERPNVFLRIARQINGCGLQRDLVFVVILVEITSESDEHIQVPLIQHLVLLPGFEVHEHLETFVHPHVEIDVPVSRTRIAVLQPAHFQGQRLLVQPSLIQVGWIDFLVDARGHSIRHRCPRTVLFKVDGRQGKLGGVGIVHFQFLESRQALLVPAPLSPHQFNSAKTQGHRFTPTRHEHPHEPNGPEVTDAVDGLLVLPHGNAELVPLDRLEGEVIWKVGGTRLQNVRQVSLANVLWCQVRRSHGDLILVVRFNRPEGQVLIDVLRVGNGGGRNGIAVRQSRVRVALVSVEKLVALQQVFAIGLGLRVSPVTVIVGRGVVLVTGQGIRFQSVFKT